MPCNPAEAASCQIGDLSGKHGALKKDTEKQVYYDKYLSTSHTDAAYVGGRSLVVHDAKMTPVACASLIKTRGTDDPVSIGVAKTPLN
ncbi:Superoxide dismutase, copper/zinc binding domain protein [Ascosphaera apis ARSEF 7405]|uniref:Superoxide dismutase, copper/zinc binding domain protein n=1 Tax=Ascosphaera apis ARSEF 7405 TaxID=392613 RepID=A0A162ITG8_9EURO|nr:Superoxide dismutase, copper/zinc binding domain protein [Ascosphaera apis ARSEF 7405]